MHECFLVLSKRFKTCLLIEVLVLFPARFLPGGVRAYTAARNLGQADRGSRRKEISQRQREIMELRRLPSRGPQQCEPRKIVRPCGFDVGGGTGDFIICPANIRPSL